LDFFGRNYAPDVPVAAPYVIGALPLPAASWWETDPATGNWRLTHGEQTARSSIATAADSRETHAGGSVRAIAGYTSIAIRGRPQRNSVLIVRYAARMGRMR
jgi:hypothetical protein